MKYDSIAWVSLVAHHLLFHIHTLSCNRSELILSAFIMSTRVSVPVARKPANTSGEPRRLQASWGRGKPRFTVTGEDDAVDMSRGILKPQ